MFEPVVVERRALRPADVLVEIAYSGICHSDIHHAQDDFGRTRYPLVPGHEIAGTVSAVGSGVRGFSVGDRVAIGCIIDSCRTCDACLAGNEQFCVEGYVVTAASVDRDGNPTQGGYSDRIVVDERFLLQVPDGMALDRTAPLLCAGVTTYSALVHWGARQGSRVAVVGFGGLGHIAVQMSRALGATTTVLDVSDDKRPDALRLGADSYVTVRSPQDLDPLAKSFDLVLCTVPAAIDVDAHLRTLRPDGTLVFIGIPNKPVSVSVMTLIAGRRAIAGTLIGGIAQTQEMLRFCAAHGIGAEVEVIDADRIDEAYRRVLSGDVRRACVGLMSENTFGRRVIVGVDDHGRSTVVRDEPSAALVARPSGAVSVEIWRQEAVPARPGDDGTRETFAPMPPPSGASFRLFSLPGGTPAETPQDAERVAAAFGGPDNVTVSEDGVLLHRTDSLYVITVVSGRAYLILGTGETLIGAGDSFVLPGAMHTFRNPFPEAAVMVTAVFAYTAAGSGQAGLNG
jgi:alcohol dehydrogenase (NADP+)